MISFLLLHTFKPQQNAPFTTEQDSSQNTLHIRFSLQHVSAPRCYHRGIFQQRRFGCPTRVSGTGRPHFVGLTLSLLMSYIYVYVCVELLVKPEILTSYIYGPTFGNAESRLFLFAAQCFNIESMQNVFLCHSCV
jgi:hypothetical protein